MTTSGGKQVKQVKQGTRRPGERAQAGAAGRRTAPGGGGRRAEDRPATVARVVPLWEGLRAGVRA
ncbi:hypothetical protein ACIRU8_13860 [Streptomyces sp. NPDC101175]|uniref:hypothetical protein n=1 Tax=Streptomyces sp. NPDC101175 TaxID=3366123 RepID=UPI003835101D